MKRKITYVAATEKEIEPMLIYLRKNAEQHSLQTFQLHGLLIDILYSGIGILNTTYSLMDYLSHRHPDGWIQAGIGGALDDNLEVEGVYQIKNEMISGFGAEDRDGRILSPFSLGWNDPDGFPFLAGLLECPYMASTALASVSGMTTFYAHGHEGHIAQMKKEPHGQIENMEGAPFFYISLVKKIPFLSIRSISNRVEARDKEKWKTAEAIQNLNECMIRLLEETEFKTDNLFKMIIR